MLKRKELKLSKQFGRDIEVLTPTGCLPMPAMMALKTGESSEQGRTNIETTPTHMLCEEPRAWYSSKEATTWLKTEERNPSS